MFGWLLPLSFCADTEVILSANAVVYCVVIRGSMIYDDVKWLIMILRYCKKDNYVKNLSLILIILDQFRGKYLKPILKN